MKLYGITDEGKARKNNEDSFFASTEKMGAFDALMIIADGMGGHSYGEIASGTCVEAFVRYMQEAEPDSPAAMMSEGVFMANYEVYKESEMRRGASMGTTLVAVGVSGNTAYVVNVGDSRLYLLNEKANSIVQITRDHSWVEDQVSKGLMERGSAEYLSRKNMITRAIGVYSEVNADQYELELREGDYLLLCSDGLSNMVEDAVIKNLALDTDFDIKKRVETLINAANNNGGRDNITCILAEYEVKA